MFESEETESEPKPGTTSYYYHCVGGANGLAQLYLHAGTLYLEGAAMVLLSSSYSALSSIRASQYPQYSEGGIEAWKRDREAARKYFEASRSLYPDLDVPILPPETTEEGQLHGPPELLMPSIEIYPAPSRAASVHSAQARKRKPGKAKTEEMSVVKDNGTDESNTWLLYIPGLVGAGTALLVVGALSFSSWRRSQG